MCPPLEQKGSLLFLATFSAGAEDESLPMANASVAIGVLYYIILSYIVKFTLCYTVMYYKKHENKPSPMRKKAGARAMVCFWNFRNSFSMLS